MRHSPTPTETPRSTAGNQYTKTTKKKVQKEPVSQRKVKRVYLQKKNSTLEGYRLVDMEIFDNFISSLVCPECYGSLQAEEDTSKKKGLASFIIILCNDCDLQTETYTSKTVQRFEEVVKGMKPLEVCNVLKK